MAKEHFLVSSTTTAPPPASGGWSEPLASLEQRYSSKHPAQYIHASTPNSLVPNSIVRITCNSAPIYSVHLLLLLLPSCMTGSSPPSSRHTYPPLATLLRAAARRRCSCNACGTLLPPSTATGIKNSVDYSLYHFYTMARKYLYIALMMGGF